MEFLKKCAAAVISTAIMGGMAVMPVIAEEMPSDELVAYITFDEAGASSSSFKATVGGTVTKKGSTALANSYKSSAGKALRISAKDAKNYLELADGLLEGKEAATYSFWFKAESDKVPNWPFMTTNEDSHTINTEKYLGMLATTESFKMERYNNSGSRLSEIVAPSSEDWQYVTAVYAPNGSKLYINGRLVASDTKAVNVAGVLTADSKTWIGHANWGDGEGFAGMIDDFRIYGKALNEDEIAALCAEAKQIETDKMVELHNCVCVNTQFYKGNNKVFQAKQGESVTVKSELNNYTAFARTIRYHIDNGDESVYSQEFTLEPMENKKVSFDITNAANGYDIVAEDITDTENTVVIDGGHLSVGDVVFPAASPVDDGGTTGAHDPTLFKDPVSGKYYTYSTHNTIAESSDLIHWTSKNYGSVITVPESNKAFVADSAFGGGAVANGTYWAPDIYYKEGDEHPYWFYVSTATNGDARNSVIGLVKSNKPTIWDGNWIDCGVVVASTKQASSPTNAIDPNIFTDSDGTTYLIWGSFWRGIHMAELDTDTGYVKGVDRTSVASTISTSNSVGRRMFSTPKGVAGPEGPYTVYNEDTGYRYMFVSYGWLGTNYNIRVARSEKPFSESGSNLLDYKDRDVSKTYGEQSDTSDFYGYKMSGSFRLGDGIEYVGSGHNSVFRDDDGEWYLIQHCRKIADNIAYLQVKKMLWTEDGWPVISPLVYAGEKEQTLPKEMLCGTWDLSSVGHMIFDKGVTSVSSSGAYKGSDMPVRSSQIVLKNDGTLGNNLGTWEFDGDHTVTVTFAKDGDTSNYEFYKAGDTMTLFALTGYDKDKRESAVVLTGIDQNGITNFAKKNNAAAADTKAPVLKPTVTEQKITDDNKAEFILNNALGIGDVTAYIAEYDDGGVLLQTIKKDVAVTTNAQKIEADFIRKSADSKVYVMVWQEMKPVVSGKTEIK